MSLATPGDWAAAVTLAVVVAACLVCMVWALATMPRPATPKPTPKPVPLTHEDRHRAGLTVP